MLTWLLTSAEQCTAPPDEWMSFWVGIKDGDLYHSCLAKIAVAGIPFYVFFALFQAIPKRSSRRRLFFDEEPPPSPFPYPFIQAFAIYIINRKETESVFGYRFGGCSLPMGICCGFAMIT